MPTSRDNADNWIELEATISRFEEALHDHHNPSIRDYLAGSGQDTVTLLLELIAAEAEHRSLKGEFVTDVEYSTAFADLFVKPDDQMRLAAIIDEVRRSVPHCAIGTNAVNNREQPGSATVPPQKHRYQLLELISPNLGTPPTAS